MARGTSQPTKETPLKLVVMDKGGVGKTALIKKVHSAGVQPSSPWSNGVLRSSTMNSSKHITLPQRIDIRRDAHLGSRNMLEIIDTGSEDTYGDGTIRDGEGFLLVYDVGDRSSLEEIRALYEAIRKGKVAVVEGSLTFTLTSSESPSVVVVSNKIDRLDKDFRLGRNGGGRESI